MQYRHVFHAGNVADVHKHIAILHMLEAMRRKAKGFLYLETHAGEGLYDLSGDDARRSGENQAGIRRLEQALAGAPGTAHPAIRAYMDAVDRIRRAHGNAPHLYPGSPLLAATMLREADHGVLVESQPQAARALQRALRSSASLLAVAPRAIAGDGYHELRALLPPPQRRGLVFIDPPYESPGEERLIAAALADGLARFETGVFALWYPIKKQHDAELFLARITRGIARPTLAAELCVAPPDHAAGLNGSGMLVINPPWRFDADAAAWQPELHGLLGGTAGSGVRWLVHEAQQ